MDKELIEILNLIKIPFYYKFDFYIGFFIGMLSLWLSLKAFREAREAKIAAAAIGKMVKLQSMTIELQEISQKLDRIDEKIKFTEARDLLSETNRKLRRLMAPLSDTSYEKKCDELKQALEMARQDLGKLIPVASAEKTDEIANVYFAMENHFSFISGLIADLIGLSENKTIEANNQ